MTRVWILPLLMLSVGCVAPAPPRVPGPSAGLEAAAFRGWPQGDISAETSSAVEIPDAVIEAANAITRSKIQQDLNYLASDRLAGRHTPSTGQDSAAAYIAGKLRRWDIQPAGDSGSFFQRYLLEREVLDTAQTFIEVNGQGFRAPHDFQVRSVGPPRPVRGRVAYVGHGVRVISRNIDPYAGLEHEGKILLAYGPAVLPGIPEEEMERPGNVWVDPWFTAPAVLWIPRFDVLEDWWQGLRRLDQTQRWHRRPSAARREDNPWIYVGPSLVEALVEGEAISAAELYGRSLAGDPPPSFELSPNREVSISIVTRPGGTFRPANVVALIEGSDPVLRQEYVTIQAHLDGRDDVVRGSDLIGNSADDNASGATALLGIAEAFARAPRPKRSVVLLWDVGEEQGLAGTRHFIERQTVPLERIATHFNLDMVGRSREPGDTTARNADLTGSDEVYVIGPRSISSELDALVEGVNSSYLRMDYDRSKDSWESEWLYPRADHAPFLRNGIPIVFYFTGMHRDYHSTSDNPDKIDVQKLERIARTAFVTAWMTADAPSRPRIDQPIPERVRR